MTSSMWLYGYWFMLSVRYKAAAHVVFQALSLASIGHAPRPPGVRMTIEPCIEVKHMLVGLK